MSNHPKYPKSAGIYKLTCIVNGKIYIGKGVNIRRRLSHHKNCEKYSLTYGYLQRAIIKHGWDSFSVEILETVTDFDNLKDNDKLLERESHFIELFESSSPDKGYNICKHSTDRTGTKCSDESREKMSKARLGIIFSEDHKENIRQSKLSNIASKETKDKMSQSHIGVTHSQESKEKISQSKKGKTFNSPEAREKMRQAKLGKPRGPFSEEHKEKLKQAALKRNQKR